MCWLVKQQQNNIIEKWDREGKMGFGNFDMEKFYLSFTVLLFVFFDTIVNTLRNNGSSLHPKLSQ